MTLASGSLRYLHEPGPSSAVVWRPALSQGSAVFQGSAVVWRPALSQGSAVACRPALSQGSPMVHRLSPARARDLSC